MNAQLKEFVIINYETQIKENRASLVLISLELLAVELGGHSFTESVARGGVWQNHLL